MWRWGNGIQTVQPTAARVKGLVVHKNAGAACAIQSSLPPAQCEADTTPHTGMSKTSWLACLLAWTAMHRADSLPTNVSWLSVTLTATKAATTTNNNHGADKSSATVPAEQTCVWKHTQQEGKQEGPELSRHQPSRHPQPPALHIINQRRHVLAGCSIVSYIDRQRSINHSKRRPQTAILPVCRKGTTAGVVCPSSAPQGAAGIGAACGPPPRSSCCNKPPSPAGLPS